MNENQIGKFIKQLRIENNLSQNELAEKLIISRQAISKWECGITIPDSQMIVKLSEIFNVSIDELFAGERRNKNNTEYIDNIKYKIYDDRNKVKKRFKFLMIFFIILFMAFLANYFINSYNSIKAYDINYMDNRFKVSEGIFIVSKKKLYFNLGTISNYEKESIKKVTIFYKDKNGEDKLIVSTNNLHIVLTENYGYNEYFDTSKLNQIINNLYLKIETSEREYDLKLQVSKNFSNDNLFFIKSSEI